MAALELPRARAALEGGVRAGLHYGAQLSVVLGDCRADICVGEAAPETPMTPDHLLCWSSSVKPLLSLALGLQQERGLLSLGDRVATHLPAFATEGKGAVTLEHCLTHTAGLWGTMAGLAADCPPARALEHICRQPLAEDWVPGRRCGYDSPAWYVGAGVVTATDPARRPYEQFVQEDLFVPLGLASCSVGMTAERYERLKAEGRLALIYNMLPRGRASPWRPVSGEDDPAQVRCPCPAGNGRGPARELAALYAALLPGRGGGPRLLREETVSLLTRPAREGLFDELQGTDTPWSLGFALRSILSGRHASPSAFGHGGSQSSWAFADPEHGLAAACLCNGKPGPEAHYRRVGEVSTALYEDLGLARGAGRDLKLPLGLGTI